MLAVPEPTRQSAPLVLLATMVLLSDNVPPSMNTPPLPEASEFPTTVLFVIDIVPELRL